MDSIGAEVGQKMRSAIKAKLMELDCYVDDELPDYIMVMVANKRTKSQMNDDLSLFLSTKTSTFVNWLHIVLKKLKEVTVTNSDVYKRVSKRKSDELPDIKLKKEKKDKKLKREELSDNFKSVKQEKSLTDDLPVTANTLSGRRKIVLLNDKNVCDDNFDIPLLSEVNDSNEKELEEIEKKIKNVKSRLGLLVESDVEADSSNANIKSEGESSTVTDSRKICILDMEINESQRKELEKTGDKVEPQHDMEQRPEHQRIIFAERDGLLKKPSVHERLGKRTNRSPDKEESRKSSFGGDYRDINNRSRSRDSKVRRRENSRDKLDSSRDRRDRSRENKVRSRGRDLTRKENILSRLGVLSKVSVPLKTADDDDDDEEDGDIVREVPSLIRVKPRVIPADVPQPNKKLLLKAVADAQRSVAQTPTVGSTLKSEGLFTKKYRTRGGDDKPVRKLAEIEKSKLKKLIRQSSERNRARDSDNYDSGAEYTPKPVKTSSDVPEYVPSSVNVKDVEEKSKQQFVVTLDGFEGVKPAAKKQFAKSRLDGRKTPSPIIFTKDETSTPTRSPPSKPGIPDRLPVIHPPLSIKNKERCKYWPGCRQGDKCEFVHPSVTCEAFPQCKFGDRCLYLHPKCKFGSACTKKDCLYDHSLGTKATCGSATTQQNCKFFPNCTNPKCQFLHPKPCKFGKYCKNMDACSFSHRFAKTSSLSWRSK
ncbi:zinc finger CCCH domain-containing protein 14 isoform X2 [Cylas formicarius]|uniref:zinc finger CCCH domain-containing protein 14 isoform X2 n=1 Tax=Cylas formicarius TaxID=197179 RepID=UPI0029587C7F|nr:zinc finger CCCH domain-containing protein 14 isoform X2 [Cylas formicarius]